jgi:DNA-binding transcriptional regulator YdaS (Cro superfamily)
MDCESDAREALKRAVDLLGGPSAAARKLKVPGQRYQTVQSWLRTRVPAQYCPSIERETSRRVVCEQIRPDIDWSVLRVDRAEPVEPAPATSAMTASALAGQSSS